jgi:hypothetical protein
VGTWTRRRSGRAGLAAVLALAWWVYVHTQAVLGPYPTLRMCVDAARGYARAHGVNAVCAWDWPSR